MFVFNFKIKAKKTANYSKLTSIDAEIGASKKKSHNWQNEWAVLKSGLPIFRRKTKNS